MFQVKMNRLVGIIINVEFLSVCPYTATSYSQCKGTWEFCNLSIMPIVYIYVLVYYGYIIEECWLMKN